MTINTWFAKHENEDNWFNKEFCELLSGRSDTTAATKVWMAIASGEASVAETLSWARHVAGQIKAELIEPKDKKTSSERERAALRAIGFFGGVDVYRGAKEFMETMASFDFLDENQKPLTNQRWTAEEWLKLLKTAGHLTEVSHKTALNRVNEWRKELGIE